MCVFAHIDKKRKLKCEMCRLSIIHGPYRPGLQGQLRAFFMTSFCYSCIIIILLIYFIISYNLLLFYYFIFIGFCTYFPKCPSLVFFLIFCVLFCFFESLLLFLLLLLLLFTTLTPLLFYLLDLYILFHFVCVICF